MAPRVSVVLPTFNRMTYLPEAVASVQAQTCADWEILLVDDESTDGTADWASRLGDPRVRYLRQLRRAGIAAARNAGLRAARGDWIAFLDSDDRWRQPKLERQMAALDGHASVRWCYANYAMMDAAGHPVPRRAGAPWRPFEGLFVDRLLTTEAAVVVPTLVVHRGLARALGFDERMPLAEDYDFVIRLAARTPGSVVDEVLADVRDHGERSTSLAGPLDGYFGKVLAYRKAAGTLPGPQLRALARRQLRSHLRVFVGRAVRHGAVGQLARVAAAMMRV